MLEPERGQELISMASQTIQVERVRWEFQKPGM